MTTPTLDQQQTIPPSEQFRRSHQCAKPGCTRKPYTARTGWLCFEHARLLHPYGAVMHPAVDALRLIVPWTQLGYSFSAVLEAAGVNRRVGTSIRELNQVQAITIERLRNLDIDRATRHPLWRAQRRLRALRAAGMLTSELMDRGMSQNSIGRVCNSSTLHESGMQRTVSGEVWTIIRDLWQERAESPVSAPSPWVASKGWRTPGMWKDIDHLRAHTPADPQIAYTEDHIRLLDLIREAEKRAEG